MRMRMTSDDPECIVRHFNIFFAENGKGYVRSGGADNQDIEEMTWIREAAKNIRAELCSEDDEGLCDELYDNLQYGVECSEGVIAYLYLAVLQAIEMRGRLKDIEDILGDEYDLDRLRELVQADREDRVHILAPSNEPLTLEFDVVDTKTGQYPDWEHIARTEDWADGLVYCDIDGIAIQEDGSLILLDECGNCVPCPRDRFEIRRPTEMED